MNIWVDADACPGVIKEILFRAAKRTQTVATFVANHAIPIPRSPYLKTVQVVKGLDVADNEIVARMQPNDLVITADIPLAAEVIAKGGVALNPRGTLYTEENIRARLNMRDFMDNLRSSGIQTGGPSELNHGDRQTFANALDRLLAKSA